MTLASARRYLAGTAGIAMVLTLGGSAPVAASSARGFVISPAFQEVSVRADQPKVHYSLSLRNTTNADQNFRLSVVDFGALDEEGGVAFLGQPATELEHRYGLASWMTVDRNTVFVPAAGAVQMVVEIDNRASLSAGGHYGAVLATAITETGQPVTDPRVGIKQVLSSLVLVSKEGGEDAILKLGSQTNDGGWWRLPGTIEQRFQNAGNVHLVPRGTVEVRDSLGKVVKRGALNEASGVILPESFRRYKTPLISVASAWMPGYYRIESTYRYDGTTQTKTFVSSFWYGGTLLVWALFGLMILAVGGGVWAWHRGFRPRLRMRWKRKR